MRAGWHRRRAGSPSAVLTPALDIVKTADVPTITPGGIVHYTITVTNTGQVPYTGASFTDPLTAVLDEADFNDDASATAGTVSFASPVLSWTGDLAPGAVATITYSVTVNNPETGDLVLTNTVTSATPGSNCASGSADPDCSVDRRGGRRDDADVYQDRGCGVGRGRRAW